MQVNAIYLHNNISTNKTNYNTFLKNQNNISFNGNQEKIVKDIFKKSLKKIYAEKLETAIANNDIKTIFEAVGIKAKRDLLGRYTVYGYGKAGGATSNFSELGIDENRLFKKIKIIKGNFDLRDSNLTDFGKLKQIDGNIIKYHATLLPIQIFKQIFIHKTVKHNGYILNFPNPEFAGCRLSLGSYWDRTHPKSHPPFTAI